MKNSNKFLIGIGLGLLTTGVAGYFLSTEEGKDFQRKTKKQLKKLEGDLAEMLEANSSAIKEKVTHLSENAKTWATEATSTLKDKLENTSEIAESTVDEVQEDFQHGVTKARKAIAEKAEEVDQVLENQLV